MAPEIDNGPVPLVGLPTDTMTEEGLVFHKTGEKYLRPIAEISRALPMMIPSLGPVVPLPDLIERLDGLVMTGAVSNVHPEHYGSEAIEEAMPFDEARDATTIELVKLALERAVPVFAICRGVQELNVALGGDLLSEVQRHEGRFDHRDPGHDDLDLRYGPRHPITIREGGRLHDILGKDRIEVNSLHRQAIETPAERLTIEALAEDGTIEAVWVKDAPAFALGVQWHPEYKASENPDSVTLFEAFGEAVRARARRRLATQQAS